MGPYSVVKLQLIETFGLSRDALHVYVGLIIFVVVAMLFRLPLRDWRPLAAVLLATLMGEALDLYERVAPVRAPFWASNWPDIWNTMFWPTILFLLARLRRF